MKNRPAMLMILDGYGLRDEEKGNAVKAANTPVLDSIMRDCPMSRLEASGTYVGLPEGQMGNSEVGHLNIGAGSIIYQNLLKITRSIESGTFFENPALCEAMDNAADGHTLHIMGLLSDGGVHSHMTHIKALVEMAARRGVKNAVVHCFLDGRDVPPKSALKYIEELEAAMKEYSCGCIGVVSGRFYAMDRDSRWERLRLAYDALTLSEGLKAATASEAVEVSYEKDETDEFVVPTVVNAIPIEDGDSVIFANFRPDRAREITRALVDESFSGWERAKVLKNLTYVCMTEYDASMPNVKLAFPPEDIEVTLGSTLAAAGLKQLRIAETEKYAHVTFFFNGGKEAPYENEDRILIPSPKVATYDLQPEMSAPEVTEKVLEKIEADEYDVYILNFANPDMVGHTGVFDACVNALETLDGFVGRICDAIKARGGLVLLTADHGNADYMADASGNPVTKHSVSQVPLCLISDEISDVKLENGSLCDIAPTLLDLIGIEIPSEMEGRSLAVR